MKTVLKLCLSSGMILVPALCQAQQPVVEGTIVQNSVPVQTGEVISYGTPVSQGTWVTTTQPGTPSTQSVTYAPGTYPVTSFTTSQTMISGGSGALSIVNQKRRSRGLPALIFDPGLTSIAQRKSQNRAYRRMTGHDGSHKGGARVEGVGYAYGGNLSSRFSTCYLYSSGYRYGGAAISYDNSGRAYYTLLLR